MSGTTQRARQVWLVDTANETIETTADAMTKPMKCILILTLFGTIIKALVSTVSDITSDVTVAINYNSFESQYPNQSLAQLFPEHSQSGRWDVILDQVRSFKHWYGMTSQELCYYTLGPILLPMVLIFIESFEYVFSEKMNQVVVVTEKMGYFVKALTIICFPLWSVIVSCLGSVFTFLEKTSMMDVSEATKAIETFESLEGRAQLIEVLAEAGIQPLLQVFVILRAPSFFIFSNVWGETKTSSHFNFELSQLFYMPEFRSIVTSILALSSTYTSNYNKRLGEKMSLAAKGVYCAHVISALISRVTCLMWFALSYYHYNNDSQNPFFCIYLTMALHISIIMSYSILFKKCSEPQQQWYMQFPVSIKNGILDGLSTLYLPYIIEENGKMDIKRHLLAHLLILVENICMSVLAVKWTQQAYLEDLMTHLLVVIWTGYGVNLFLEVLFNTFLHPSIIGPPPKEKTDVEKSISACLKMLAQIFLIIIANVVLVSSVFSNLSQMQVFWTLVPICLSTAFYMIEWIKFLRSNDSFCGMSFPVRAIITALCPLWPISILFLVLFCKFKKKDSKKVEVLVKFTTKVVVCTLTSLQCLLKLYLMLPTLTKPDWANIVVWTSMYLWFYKAQILTIFISLGLMAYYYLSSHSHYAEMTTACKGVYALQILLASFSRLLFINLFVTSLEAFYFVCLVMMFHFFIVLLVDIAVDLKAHKKTVITTDFFLRVLTNTFSYPAEKEEPNDMMKHLSVEWVILLENLAFWISMVLSLNSDYFVILLVSWIIYVLALLLKIIFYLKLHPNSTQIKEKVTSK